MARAKNIVSVARNIGLVLGTTIGLSACSVVQENPNYQYSTKYQGQGTTGTTYASNGVYTTPASYTQASSQSYSGQSYTSSSASRAEEECRNKESNREIIGGAAGGALGAFAGNKLIGGTAGTIGGAAIGGIAGYGLGDISVDCSPAQTYQPAPVQASTQTTYQPAPTQVYQAAPAAYSEPVIYSEPVTYGATTSHSVTSTDTLYSNQTVNGTPGYAVYQGNNSPQTLSETISAPVQVTPTFSANGAQEISNYDYSANLISADTPINAQSFPGTETRILGGNTFGTQSYIVQPGDTVYGLSRKLCVGIGEIQSQNSINANYGINIGQTIQLPQNRC